MECCCYLRNTQDLSSDGEKPCERRFDTALDGPITLFGAEKEYHPGICIGYALISGGSWTGDLLILVADYINHRPASEIHRKRFKAKGVE